MTVTFFTCTEENPECTAKSSLVTTQVGCTKILVQIPMFTEKLVGKDWR